MKNKSEIKQIILFAVYVKTIKAKLGMSRRQHVFLAESELIQAAMEKNMLKLLKSKFEHHKLWKKQHKDIKKAIAIQGTGLKGGTALKKVGFAALNGTLKKALAFVNGEALDNQAEAVQLIESVFMKVINAPRRVLAALTVKQLKAAGCIKVKAIAAKYRGKYVRASYDWGYSVDGGITWMDLKSNHKAFIKVSNLESGVSHIFRSRVSTERAGTSRWVISKAISPL